MIYKKTKLDAMPESCIQCTDGECKLGLLEDGISINLSYHSERATDCPLVELNCPVLDLLLTGKLLTYKP